MKKEINIESPITDSIILTRKITLIPTFSDKKEWHKRVYNFSIEDLTKKINYKENYLSKNKNIEKEDKEKIRKSILDINLIVKK